MLNLAQALQVKCFRKKFHTFAGKVKLSRGFKTEQEALFDLEENKDFYTYWAQSAEASIENAIKTGKCKNVFL